MVETWLLWLFLVGLATGAVATFVVLVRLPRRESDVSVAERPAEAAWISAIIERDGGVAPVLLVEEVLELHQAYLREPRPPVPTMPAPGVTDPLPAAYQPLPGPPMGLGQSASPDLPQGGADLPQGRPVLPPPVMPPRRR